MMSKQIVSIIEFPILYNILNEVKHLFTFDICNYKNYEDFLNESKLNTNKNLIIISKKENYLSLQNQNINQNNILVFDLLPIKIEKILDEININLIKQKYHSQSKLVIKGYDLNLNSRTIIYNNIELKLTEKEIQIILFLNNEKNANSVSVLQKQVWGYSSELETHTVETHIYRLRKKIKDKFKDDKFILSNENGYQI